MRGFRFLLAALLVPGSVAALPPLDPAPIVAAERAFAEDGLKRGIKASFLKAAAPGAIMFRPDPVNAQATFGPDDDKLGPPLVWWPLWAGIARSGDLGFTTGPFTYDGKPGGYYFTIWKKQADGTWKWQLDAGPPSDAVDAAPQGSKPDYLMLGSSRDRRTVSGFREVQLAERTLAKAARADVSSAYRKILVPDGRVVGSSRPPVNSPTGQAAELGTRASQIEFSHLGGEASKAGDLAWTYGDAHWRKAGRDLRGHYVRIWQWRGSGWRLVFDELLEVHPRN